MTAPTRMETTCPGPGLRFHWPVFGVDLPVVGQPAGRLDGLPAPKLAAVLARGRHTDVDYSLADWQPTIRLSTLRVFCSALLKFARASGATFRRVQSQPQY